jgi:hypothetical protein
MVPGVNVARVDANTWAISIRGFNGIYANKQMVLVDGRSVYTPAFSGVYWDQLNSMPPEEMVGTIRRVYEGKMHVPPEVATNWRVIMRKTPSLPEKWRFFSRSRTVRGIVISQASSAFPSIR